MTDFSKVWKKGGVAPLMMQKVYYLSTFSAVSAIPVGDANYFQIQYQISIQGRVITSVFVVGRMLLAVCAKSKRTSFNKFHQVLRRGKRVELSQLTLESKGFIKNGSMADPEYNLPLRPQVARRLHV